MGGGGRKEEEVKDKVRGRKGVLNMYVYMSKSRTTTP